MFSCLPPQWSLVQRLPHFDFRRGVNPTTPSHDEAARQSSLSDMKIPLEKPKFVLLTAINNTPRGIHVEYYFSRQIDATWNFYQSPAKIDATWNIIVRQFRHPHSTRDGRRGRPTKITITAKISPTSATASAITSTNTNHVGVL